MFYSEEDLQNLKGEHSTVSAKFIRLLKGYIYRRYNDPRAQEHAHHGFSRRLKTLVRCIDNTFEILPPDRVDPLTIEEQYDANINLHAFVFNVFGCVDNLAWIWVAEKNVTKEDGSPIPNEWVGLRKKNKLVCNSFSREFQDYLNGLNAWFDYQENFRHALAHRIPLYIPPYRITDDKEAAYRDFEGRMTDAFNRSNFEEYDRLSAEQDALGEFMPVMTHSFQEGAKLVVVHPQLLADFNTIEELGRKMLEELDR